MSFPSIHDAFSNMNSPSKGQLNKKSSFPEVSQTKIAPREAAEQVQEGKKYPKDASHSKYPITIKCPKCNNLAITRLNSEMGAAAWVWCVLLAPFACSGIVCLCLESCRDKIHYCTRCGEVVGKKYAKVC